MARNRWVGGGAAVAQIQTWTFAGTPWVVGETITVTIGSKAITYTIASATIATFLAALQTVLAGLSSTVYPEFAEVTWTNPTGSTIVGTANTGGYPFTATFSTNSAAGTINGSASSAGTATVPSSGPNDWSTATNWSLGAVPVNTNDVDLDDPTWSILYGLAQSGVTLASLNAYARFAGNDNNGGTVGLPLINTNAVAYPEYRPQYLQIGVTNTYIGLGDGFGSGRIKLDFGSVAANVYVYSSGTSPDGLAAIMLKGTNAANLINVTGQCEVGIALVAGETANISGGLTIGAGAVVTCGAGCTIATIQNNGGSIETRGAIGTSLTQLDGDSTLNGTGAIAQLTIRGGSCTYNTSGTLGGNTIVSGPGLLDFSQDQRTKTVTNAISLYGTASALVDVDKVISTLVVDLYEGADVSQVVWGSQIKLTRGTPP